MLSAAQPVIVTSPPLSHEAGALLREYFPAGSVLTWQHGDRQSQAAIRTNLLSGAWPLCISFYNDYIFSREEIEALGCVVNIHPAHPGLRGRGYDILPLLEKHCEHGVTLHFVSEVIDAGEIIEVVTQPVPPAIRYQEFRARNQELSLAMLDRLLSRCRHAGMSHLQQELKRTAAMAGLSWSGGFVTSEKLACRLRELRSREPDHPLLRHIPRELEFGLATDAIQAVWPVSA